MMIKELSNEEKIHIPENLQLAINLSNAGKPSTPARLLYNFDSILSAQWKEVRRHQKFTGAVNVDWLARELQLSHDILENVLKLKNCEKIEDKWYADFSYSMPSAKNHHNVFHNTLQKMFYFCGPLSVVEICGGIEMSVSRTQYPTPPPNVISTLLFQYKYNYDDNLFYWNEYEHEQKLSNSEQVICECIAQYGPVVHHQTLVQAFVDSNMSFPSLHGTLKRSPIFERVGKALYKLRGYIITQEDKDRAKLSASRTPVEIEIEYLMTGALAVNATLGLSAVASGTLFSENLPDLSGKWRLVVSDNQLREITVTKSEIRGLKKAFHLLNIEIGNRVTLTFDTRNRSLIVSRFDNN